MVQYIKAFDVENDKGLAFHQPELTISPRSTEVGEDKWKVWFMSMKKDKIVFYSACSYGGGGWSTVTDDDIRKRELQGTEGRERYDRERATRVVSGYFGTMSATTAIYKSANPTSPSTNQQRCCVHMGNTMC